MKRMILKIAYAVANLIPRLEDREILICEQCHSSDYAKWECGKCGHLVGTPVQTASGQWSMQ